MKLQMVGCSHHNSSLALRERLAFNPVQTAEALDRWRLRYPATEAVLLSTCNRIEIYTAWDTDSAGPNHKQVAEFLAEFHGIDLCAIFDDLFEQSGEEALRYLRDEGARNITIINRSPERAATMAGQFSGQPVPWEQLDDWLVAADLVVSTTGAAEPIVTLARFQRIESRRYQRPLL